MAGLTDTLELDLTEALRGIDTVEAHATAAFAASAQSFKVGLVDALSLLSQVDVQADAANVTRAIDEATAAADTNVAVTADASAVTAGLDDALAAADNEVPVAADGLSQVTDDITDAVAAANTTVDVSVNVEAPDISEATDDLGALNAEAQGAAGGLREVSSASVLASIGSEVAAGRLTELRAALPSAGLLGGVAAGFGTVAGIAGVLGTRALEAEQVQKRWNRALGESADEVDSIDVGGLTTDLRELAAMAGAGSGKLRTATADLFELGLSSGATRPELEATTERIAALSARAAVLRPALGNVGEILPGLTNALARGNRALTPYGLSITSAEISARALADTGKTLSTELTVYERAAAGAALATERLGDTLAEDITTGSETGVIQLRRLQVEFGRVLTALGRPLAGDFVDTLEAVQPVMEGVATVVGDLAAAALPLFVDGLDAATPAVAALAAGAGVLADGLGFVVDIVSAVPDPVMEGVAAYLIYARILRELAVASGIYARVKVAETAATAAGTVADRAAAAAKMEYVGAAGLSNRVTGGAAKGFGGLRGAVTSLFSPLGLVTAGLALGTVALVNHRKEQEETKRHVEALTDAFRDQSTSFEEDIGALVSNRFSGLTENLRELGLGFSDLEEFATRGEQGVIDFVRGLEAAGHATDGFADAFERARANGQTFGQAMDTAKSSGEDIDGVAEKVALTLGKVQKSAQVAANETVRLAVAHDRSLEPALRAAEAKNRLANGDIDHVAVLRELLPDQAKQADQLDATAAAAGGVADATQGMLGNFAALTVEQDAFLRGLDLMGPGLVDLTRRFADGGLTTEEFRQAVANTNMTADEMLDVLVAGRTALEAYDKTVGDDLTRSLDKAGPAFGAVIDAAARGTLTHEQFLAVVARTDITADELNAALDTAVDAIDGYVNEVVGRLPDIQDAFDDLGERPGLDTFVSKVGDQAKELAGNDAVEEFARDVARQLSDLEKQPGGLGTFVARVEAQARALGRQPGLDAFVKKVKAQAEDVGRLPGLDAFVAKFEQQARDIAAFAGNIADIAGRGATELADALLVQGPTPGGAVIAAEAARLGDAALAQREQRFRRAEASQDASERRLEELARAHAARMLGIVTTNRELLSALPGPDLTSPLVTAAQRALDSLRREETRLAAQAAATAFGPAVPETRAMGQRLSRELLAGVIDGGEDGAASVAAGIRRALGAAIGSAAEGLPAEVGARMRTSGMQLARELLVGVTVGADSGADELFRAGERAAGALDAGMRSHLEISSPSRLGTRRGASYTEGVALGVADTGPVDAAVAALAARVSRPLAGVASVAVAPALAAAQPAGSVAPGVAEPARGDRLVAETAAMRAQGLETLVLLRRLVDAAGGIGDATADAIRRTGTDGRFLPAAMRG